MVSDQLMVSSDMLDIKKHLLNLGNSMATSDLAYEPNENQTTPSWVLNDLFIPPR